MAGNTQPNPSSLAAIQKAAKANGIDWRAPAAIAYHESGLNPASVGDNGTSFGFFQLHQGGALPAGTPISQATNPDWNAQFAARAIKALGIQNLPVNQQIYQISKRFERPTNVAGEVADAQNYYRTTLAGLGATPGATPGAAPAATGTAPTQATAPTLAAPTFNQASLAPLQQSLALGTQANQRALDALGKISGVKSTAAAAPDLSSLLQAQQPAQTLQNPNTQTAAPTKPTGVTVPLKGKTPSGISPEGQKAVELAKHYLGTKYVYGGETPKGFDCSGLLQYVWGKLGVSIPRTAAEQFKAGKPVNTADLQPGDALAFRESNGTIGHIGMYVGGGQFVQAPHTGDVVKISPLAGHYQSILAGAVRFS